MSDTHWRLFVSIAVPDRVRNEIGQVQKRMREAISADSVRWTRNDQIHLTLKFLGNVPAAKVEELTTALTQATNGFSCFELRAKGLGFFPPKRIPRVVWIGIESDQDLLLKLQAGVARATELFTNEREERSFSGHLTLGRVKKISRAEAQRLCDFGEKLADRCLGQWPVSSIALMRSELEPSGARHSCVGSFPLSH